MSNYFRYFMLFVNFVGVFSYIIKMYNIKECVYTLQKYDDVILCDYL